MAKLLPSRLPTALNEVNADLFNRLVRILELNLGQFDPSRTPQFNDTELSEFNFVAGDVVWNTNIGVLQVYTGNTWIQLHEPFSPQGYEANALVGSVTVKNNGDTTITLGVASEYWDVEKWYT